MLRDTLSERRRTTTLKATEWMMGQTRGRTTLPEDLVEKIIARMPFPSIFKARCLSKSWLARFSSISSLHVEEEKWLATSFQKEVSKWSNNWDTFSPILFREDVVKGLDGHEVVKWLIKQASQNWSRIPSLSFLPFHTDRLTKMIECLQEYFWYFSPGNSLTWEIEGPLLYGFAHENNLSWDVGHVFVANVLTRSWRHLPPRPDALVTPVFCHKVVIHPSSEKYKVILVVKVFPQKGVCRYYAQIFDSKLDVWSSSKYIEGSTDFRYGPPTLAHIDGVLYMTARITPQILLAFNLEEGSVEEVTLSLNNDNLLRATTVRLVVCNSNRLMLVAGHEDTERHAVQVFDIELGERRLVPLTVSPRECPPNLGFRVLPPMGDGNCILFWKVDYAALPRREIRKPSGKLARRECFRVVAYNVDEDVWTSFPVPEETMAPGFAKMRFIWFGSFRPGLSPFLAV